MPCPPKQHSDEYGFLSLVGQNRLKEKLVYLLSVGIPGHAYAFTGADGMGKRSFARLFAAQWLCTDEYLQPCGKCLSCRTFEAGTNPDVVLIQTKERQIRIESIRDLQEAFSTRASYGKKLCIIEEAEKMNESAQNCLLKTLEEPPKNTLLLLTTSGYDSLQTTIRSRVSKLPMDGYSEKELRTISKKQTGLEPSPFLIAFSQGNPGRMITLQKSETLDINRKMVLGLVDTKPHLLEATGAESLWKYLSANKEQFQECIGLLQGLLRDLLSIHENVDNMLINSDKTDTIRVTAKRRTREYWIAAIEKTDDIQSSMMDSLNYQIAVDMLNTVLEPLFGIG